MERMPKPEVGQIWKDMDPRCRNRYLQIIEVGAENLLFIEGHFHGDAWKLHSGKPRRAKISRFNGSKSGYGFVKATGQ